MGASIAIPLTPRNVGAGLGVLAAVVTVGLIGSRLYDAAAPVSTPWVLSSTSATRISVESLWINNQAVLPAGWTPSDVEGDRTPSNSSQGKVALQVGRPVDVRASFSVPRAATASCSLEPRPHGACLLRIRFYAASDMRCDFDCKIEVPKP